MKQLAGLLFASLFLLSATHSNAQINYQKKNNMKTKKVLFVLSSSDKVPTNEKPTGTWLEEFAAPFYYLSDKGVEITIVTPKGGNAPIDPKSELPEYSTAFVKRFKDDKTTQEKLKTTKKITNINLNDYDAVFYPGGHGPMWDLVDDKNSIHIIESFYQQHKPVALVCHAPVALVNTRSVNGEPLVKGKKIAGYSNSEEQAGQSTDLIPFLLEDKLKEKGAIYEKGADWHAFATSDGLLFTGQNPASAALVAENVYKALSE